MLKVDSIDDAPPSRVLTFDEAIAFDAAIELDRMNRQLAGELAKLQWSGWKAGALLCPSCGAMPPNHDANCTLAAALAAFVTFDIANVEAAHAALKTRSHRLGCMLMLAATGAWALFLSAFFFWLAARA